jgi:hypothetical protein
VRHGICLTVGGLLRDALAASKFRNSNLAF